MQSKEIYTMTYTGRKISLLDPKPEDMELEDIAQGLANIVRFGGQIGPAYTVAQHSILVSRNCRTENALWGLMHDASEAFLGDMISPIKELFPDYRSLERKYMDAIVEKFHLNCLYEPYDVWEADKRLVMTEHNLLRSQGKDEMLWRTVASSKLQPYDWKGIEVMDHIEAKRAFLERFENLRQDSRPL